jgi:hypothetical protein
MPPAKSANEEPTSVAALTSSATTGTANPSGRRITYSRKKPSFDNDPRTVTLNEHKRYGATLAQLNRQDSDDLVEYEAHLKAHTPTELGKRDRTDSPNKEELNREPERPTRRPVRFSMYFSAPRIWPITRWGCRGQLPAASLRFKPKCPNRRRSAFVIL